MKQKIIDLSDNIKVTDKVHNNANRAPITGVIRIYDKDGNLVKETHNMIVNGGRILLYGLFLRYGLYGDVSDESKLTAKFPQTNITGLSNNQLTNPVIADFKCGTFGVHFGYTSETVKTVSSMNLDDVNEITSSTQDSYLDINDSSSGADVDFDVYELKVTFKSTIKGDTWFQKFNQIYLTYKLPAEGGEQQEYLFSRVVMDPVFLGEDGEYSIHYSLYF